ncbi:MAG: hypothetical protein AB1476_05445 [Candidatus Hadarchaeota archaeon]
MAARNSDVGRKALEEFRKKVREVRAAEWRRDARLLRDRTPEETISAMFDLVNFAENLSRAKKCEP